MLFQEARNSTGSPKAELYANTAFQIKILPRARLTDKKDMKEKKNFYMKKWAIY
jgi:hypothetical protein